MNTNNLRAFKVKAKTKEATALIAPIRTFTKPGVSASETKELAPSKKH